MDDSTTRDDDAGDHTEVAEVPAHDHFGFEPGALLGDYRIERPLGRGGMGVVFEAIHPVIGKRAAIKVLKKELCRDHTAVQRFVDEARAVNQIGHPNLVDIFSFGECLGGRSYFVMELLDGETLRTRLERPITYPELVGIFKPLARALQAAHAKGVIHRDLKPENVMLIETPGELPRVKLLDFGIAKLLGPADLSGKTSSGEMIGTPVYIAPEQARGKAVDARADIYSLGAILFETLTGRPPFLANNVPDMLRMHVGEVPDRVSTINPGVPPELDAMIAAMLDKTVEARPGLDELCALLVEIEKLPGLIDPPPRPSTPLAFSIPALPPPPTGPLIARPIERITPTLPNPPSSIGAPSRSSAMTIAKEVPRRGTPALVWVLIGITTLGASAAAFAIVRAHRTSSVDEVAVAIDPRAGNADTAVTVDANPLAIDAAVESPVAIDAAAERVVPDGPGDTPAPTGRLVVELVPRGANLTVDGKRTPAGAIDLAPGRHELLAEAKGWVPARRTIAIAAGDRITMSLALSRRGPAPAPRAGSGSNRDDDRATFKPGAFTPRKP